MQDAVRMPTESMQPMSACWLEQTLCRGAPSDSTEPHSPRGCHPGQVTEPGINNSRDELGEKEEKQLGDKFSFLPQCRVSESVGPRGLCVIECYRINQLHVFFS